MEMIRISNITKNDDKPVPVPVHIVVGRERFLHPFLSLPNYVGPKDNFPSVQTDSQAIEEQEIICSFPVHALSIQQNLF